MYSISWLNNGFVLVLDRGSKLRALIDPETAQIRHGDLWLSPEDIRTILEL